MKIKTKTLTIDSRNLRKTLSKSWKTHQRLNKKLGRDANGDMAIKLVLKHLNNLINRPGWYQRNSVED